jgi:hypothetical protein
MNDIDRQTDGNKRQVSLKNLYLDANNYRLIHEPDYVEVSADKIKDKSVQRRTLHLTTGDKDQHIQDLIDSFKSNGYLPVDQIQVRPLSDGGYVVVEGNRRVAALKRLQREDSTPLFSPRFRLFSTLMLMRCTT